MPRPTPPPPLDHTPARWVEALHALWIDPLEVAFADLQARRDLEALRERVARRERDSDEQRAARPADREVEPGGVG
jgi:hypothetical protein